MDLSHLKRCLAVKNKICINEVLVLTEVNSESRIYTLGTITVPKLEQLGYYWVQKDNTTNKMTVHFVFLDNIVTFIIALGLHVA